VMVARKEIYIESIRGCREEIMLIGLTHIVWLVTTTMLATEVGVVAVAGGVAILEPPKSCVELRITVQFA
jgi:hypothetical protein